jgi:hypothetical protein
MPRKEYFTLDTVESSCLHDASALMAQTCDAISVLYV